MNRKQKNKCLVVCVVVTLLGAATGLVLYALKQNINLFYTPSEILASQISFDQTIRMGGYVKKQSVHYSQSGEDVDFVVTDRTHELTVHYAGVLPNLFREGQTVVVTGKITPDRTFLANEVLAKHDERYMPRPLKNLQKGNGYGA